MTLPPQAVATAVTSFVAMEPVTYLAHRFVMHGFGMGWHRSHHRRRAGRFERNDLFPLVFAGTSMAGVAAGFHAPRWARLLPVLAGVAGYGASYLFVHDLYIHRRVRRFTASAAVLDRLADAHALHHRFGGEPYGMLVPVVPAAVRARAGGAVRGSVPNGSMPSQVPSDP